MLSIDLLQAQPGKEAWHWLFGYQTSLDFSSGISVLGTCAIDSKAAGASISDNNTGNLLFYTDGIDVYDKNNNILLNGMGLNSIPDNQWVIIIPKPNNTNLYYIIYTSFSGPSAGIYYSIVDMSQNGGLGAVTIKNQILISGILENKITAIKNCNGMDYWLITHLANSNTFSTYLISSSGISQSPVNSNVGSIYMQDQYGNPATMAIKATPNGKKIATTFFIYDTKQKVLELYDFNSATGQLSNSITIPDTAKPYDYEENYISFSPDSKKLYYSNYSFISQSPPLQANQIYQFDVSTSIPSIINASKSNIYRYLSSNNTTGAMQLAPDGKIYLVCSDSNTMAVINNPNNLGSTCNFQKVTLTLNTDGFTNQFNYGLPNFIDANYITSNSFPVVSTFNKPLCSFTTFTLNASSVGSNYNWSTLSNAVSTLINDTGKYWVNYTDSEGCQEADTFYVTYTVPPVINNLHDTTYCSSLLPLNINATYLNTTNYVWDDSVKTATHAFNLSGTYWVDYYLNNNCTARDSFKLTIKEVLTPDSFPNIVTPNNDDINDYIDFSKYELASLQLEIYNRWGNKIFESTNPNCIWKPTEEDGTYYYIAQFGINCGKENQSKTLKGFITLIR